MMPRFTNLDQLRDGHKTAASNYSTKRSSFTALLLDGTKTVVLPVIKINLSSLPVAGSDSTSSDKTGKTPAAS
jgi:hypothetical protein